MTQASPGVIIKELDPECDRRKFTCGDRQIDSWFRDKAQKRHNRRSVRVKTAHLPGNSAAVGFSALSICEKPLSYLDSAIEKEGWDTTSFPACYLYLLGVHSGLQGRGIGTRLLLDAIVATYAVSLYVGIHGLVVTASDGGKVPFYQRLGFGIIGPDHPSPHMLLPIQSIEDLVAQSADEPE